MMCPQQDPEDHAGRFASYRLIDSFQVCSQVILSPQEERKEGAGRADAGRLAGSKEARRKFRR